MDISSLSATAVQMSSGRDQSALTTAMIKQDAKQQNQMADLLSQSIKTLSQNVPQPDSRYQFSQYA